MVDELSEQAGLRAGEHPADQQGSFSARRFFRHEGRRSERRRDGVSPADESAPVLHVFLGREFSNSPRRLFDAQRSFAVSTAVVFVVEHVFCIRVPDLGSMRVVMTTAEAVHDAFGAFSGAVSPEDANFVPFVLSDQVLDGMGFLRQHGAFREACARALAMLVDRRVDVVAFLEFSRPCGPFRRGVLGQALDRFRAISRDCRASQDALDRHVDGLISDALSSDALGPGN